MITFPASPERLDYTVTPWTDDNGNKWLYQPSVNRWIPFGTGGGGASTFAQLTDKATADLPTINTPLSQALAGKAPSTHTHASAAITDSSTGGNGEADAGKLVSFGADGELTPSYIVIGTLGSFTETTLSLADSTLSHHGTFQVGALTGDVIYTGPSTGGTLALTARTDGVPDALLIGNNYATASADASVTVTVASHMGKWLRLTGSSGTQTIALPTDAPLGAEFMFFRAGAAALAFGSGPVINGSARLADVVQNSAFAVKCSTAGSTYDFI
jgi:hypothetical protein